MDWCSVWFGDEHLLEHLKRSYATWCLKVLCPMGSEAHIGSWCGIKMGSQSEIVHLISLILDHIPVCNVIRVASL